MRINVYRDLIGSMMFKNKISEITFFVTEKCNMNCPHCFNGMKNRLDERRELSVSEIEKIMFPCGSMTRLLLSGGEPFLRKDLADICIAFMKNTRISHLTIPTNGSLSEKTVSDVVKIASEFPEVSIEIKFSLDQIGEKRDQFTKYPGGSDRLIQTSQRLKEIKKEYQNIRIGAITTIVPENQYDIDEIFRFAKKILEVDDYSLSLARGFKGYNPEFNMKHLAKHYKDIYGTSPIRLEPGFLRGIINKIILYRNFLDIKYRYDEPEYMKCHSGKVRFVMDPYGNVYPCELKGYPYSEEKGFSWFIGNIRDFEYSFETLLKSKKAFQIREHIIKSKCVCNHGCDMNNNIIHNMDQIIKALIFSGSKLDAYLKEK